MISQSDIAARLRLFRYGLVVIVVVTFMVSLLAPMAALQNVPNAPPITAHLGTALLLTVVVAVLMVIAYFAYQYVLNKTVASSDTQASQNPVESSAD
jgi:putative copper export protein